MQCPEQFDLIKSFVLWAFKPSKTKLYPSSIYCLKSVLEHFVTINGKSVPHVFVGDFREVCLASGFDISGDGAASHLYATDSSAYEKFRDSGRSPKIAIEEIERQLKNIPVED